MSAASAARATNIKVNTRGRTGRRAYAPDRLRRSARDPDDHVRRHDGRGRHRRQPRPAPDLRPRTRTPSCATRSPPRSTWPPTRSSTPATGTSARTRSSPGRTTSRPPSVPPTTTPSTCPPARTRAARGRNSARCSSPAGRALWTPCPTPSARPTPRSRRTGPARATSRGRHGRSAATDLAERIGQQLDRGRGLGHGRLRPRADPQPGPPDNYNNPYAAPFQRAATGYWSMMSRGSFGGPGGTHTRWHIPQHAGHGPRVAARHARQDRARISSTGANFIDLNRNGLATSGLAVVDVTAREVGPVDDAIRPASASTSMARPRRTRTSRARSSRRRLAAAAAAGDTNIKVASVSGITVGQRPGRRRPRQRRGRHASRASARPAPAARAWILSHH